MLLLWLVSHFLGQDENENVPLSGSLAEVLFLISKLRGGHRVLRSGWNLKKWKKSVKKGPSSHPIRWSSWICTGRPVSLLKSWLFLAVAACWNKKKGRDIGRFSREANQPFPTSDGEALGNSTMGFWGWFFHPKKGGPRKWIWNWRNFAETETGLGKRKNHQKPESPTNFFLKPKPSFGRCAWAHHTTWSPWSSRKRCDIFEEISILGARFIGFSEKTSVTFGGTSFWNWHISDGKLFQRSVWLTTSQVGNVGRCQGFLYWMSYPFVSFLACFQVGGFKHIYLYIYIYTFFF